MFDTIAIWRKTSFSPSKKRPYQKSISHPKKIDIFRLIRPTMRSFLLVSCALSTLLPLAPASAQSNEDVLVMRRAVMHPKDSSDKMRPVEGADLSAHYWVTSDWIRGDPACTDQHEQRRLRGCVYNGQPSNEANCPQPPPEKTRIVEDYRACNYGWQTTSVGAWNATCSEATRAVTSECRRQDGELAADIRCSGQPRPQKENGFNEEGCTYEWAIGEWGDWDSQCSASAKRERSVACIRSNGSTAADSLCPEPKEDSFETGENYSNCEYRWQPSLWVSDEQSCGGTVRQTRTVTCLRTDGLEGDPSLCQDPMPSLERQEQDFDACSHEWKTGEWGRWNSQCSPTSRREREVWCEREDGKQVEDEKCAGSKPDAENTAEILTNCSYKWVTGDWTVAPQCSATAESTRKVTCQRSDGKEVDGDLCDATQRPNDIRAIEEYSNCTYDWEVGPATWSSNCSDAATATSTIKCIRSDGAEAADQNCVLGDKPPATVTRANYEGCPADWAKSEWTDWSSQCSDNASRSRDVQCVQERPSTTVVVDNNTCNAQEKPINTENNSIWSGCIAEWDIGSWGWNGIPKAKSSTCSASPEQNRTVTCRKRFAPDGAYETIEDSSCPQPKPEQNHNLTPDYEGCTYEWSPGPWSNWDSTCSENARRTRTTQCLRKDGSNTVVDKSFCDQDHEDAKESETANVVIDCGGLLNNGDFEKDLQGWTTYYSATIIDDSYAGLKAVRIGAGKTYIYQRFNVKPSSISLSVNLYCKQVGSSSGMVLSLESYNGVNHDYKIFPLNCSPTVWTKNTFSMPVTNQTNSLIKITGQDSSSSHKIVVDNIVVTEN